MQIDPIGKKANLLISLAMSTGSNPQAVINTVRELEVRERVETETNLGSIFFKDINGKFEEFFTKTGKLVLKLLEENIDPNVSEKWEEWSEDFKTSLGKWFPDKAFEDRFSKLVDLPLHSWTYYEDLIRKLDDFTRPSKNKEGLSEQRELECKLIDHPTNTKPYIDAIFTREVGSQVTTFALKEGGDKMVFPKDPFETIFYNVTVSKFNQGRWDFARMVFHTNDKEIAKEIHETALKSSKSSTPRLAVSHMGSSKFNNLIHNVVYGNH